MNALELLQQDHEKVSSLFEQAQSSQDTRPLFEQIARELETHTHIEETIFYPALKQHAEMQDLLKEAYEEHAEVKKMIRQINTLTDSGDMLTQMQQLQQNVEHHVEEEETEMFPRVEQLFDDAQLQQLGQQMNSAKYKFSSQWRMAAGASGR